ncbi:FGGY-family carbohydrate kinase [Rhodovibrio salinarum]|uniref:Carbohydrate kinase n=1 Tax=Rhodovibrio salinarum TaxID=1087 RepID=A0A934QF75_9PROT|nr:FGGY-family carbohydrate kinase [Rhodovibrio salinarum]MBK1695754.1 carbohydrate kinase [Rhodovibrio salinarum]
MSGPILIGLDAGTSVIKAVAFTADGQQLAVASQPNDYRIGPDGAAEQDMHRTWRNVVAVLQDLLADAPEVAARAAVLAVTGQGDGCWLIDGDGEPVHDGLLWLDARAAGEARAVDTGPGAETVYRTTGTGMNGCQMRAQLRWLRRHMPDQVQRAATALHPKDWLYYRLTGERATCPSEGVFTFGDFRTRDYSPDVLAALELTDLGHLLPPIVDGTCQSASLAGAAAAETGLPQGLPVVLGYVDVVCAALGGGLYEPTTRPGLTILGSTGVHIDFAATAEDVHLNARRCGYTMALPGTACAQMQTNMAATLNICWLRDLAAEVLSLAEKAPEPEELLTALDGQVINARPGAALFHPYISTAGERGPFTDPHARASFTGLDHTIGFADLMRSVYEGLALSARDCYVAMGPIPSEIRLTGGAARSAAMRAILAAVLDRPVRVADRAESGAAGACMIAAVQQGLYPDMSACAAAWVTPYLGAPEMPDAQLAGTYEPLFQGYLETRQALAPVWPRMAELRSMS